MAASERSDEEVRGSSALLSTTQRAAELELRRSEELFARAFRLGPVAMGIIRVADSRIVDLNDAAAALVGRTREEIVGRTSAELGLWIEPRVAMLTWRNYSRAARFVTSRSRCRAKTARSATR